MRPLSRERVFNKASRHHAIPTCELHRRELRNGSNRGRLEEGEWGLPLHPTCYYLYSIAKHASGNQHEIVNCSAHLCVAQGTGAFRRSCVEQVRAAQLTACISGLPLDTKHCPSCIHEASSKLYSFAVVFRGGVIFMVYLRRNLSMYLLLG